VKTGPLLGGEPADVLAVTVERQYRLAQKVLVTVERERPQLTALYHVPQSVAEATDHRL
jgi:hypothetical protein